MNNSSSTVSQSGGKQRQEVILLRGRGKKRIFNNCSAVVLDEIVNPGGWVTVQLASDDEEGSLTKRVRWRNKAWRPMNTQSTASKKKDLTGTLEDDCLIKIFSFLGAGENPPEAFDSSHDDPAGELMDMDVAPESVSTQLSLPEAKQLHLTISLVCKRFRKVCRRNLRSILGKLDADLMVFPWWDYVPWMAKHRLALRSVKLKGFVLADAAILLHILR